MGTTRKRYKRTNNKRLYEDQLSYMLIGNATIFGEKWYGDWEFPYFDDDEYHSEYLKRKQELIDYAVKHKWTLNIPYALRDWESPEEAERLFAIIKQRIQEAENANK